MLLLALRLSYSHITNGREGNTVNIYCCCFLCYFRNLQVLDNLGVAHSGSGTNIAEASSPAIIIRGGYKVAFLSYADHYDDWAAGTNTPGINYIDPARYTGESRFC